MMDEYLRRASKSLFAYGAIDVTNAYPGYGTGGIIDSPLGMIVTGGEIETDCVHFDCSYVPDSV